MKAPLFFLLVIAAHSASAALVFTDDFNRANTTPITGGLGSNWDITGGMYLDSNVAKTQTGGTSFALYNGFDLSQNISLSIDLYALSTDRYGGFVFNYQDPGNYYIFRAAFSNATTGTKAWQFLKVVDGAAPVIISNGTFTATDMPLSTWRTFKLAGGENGNYTFSITSLDGSVTVTNGLLSDTTFGVSGQAGFYFGNSFMWADNFSLTTVPEPSTWGLLGAASALGLWFRRRRLP